MYKLVNPSRGAGVHELRSIEGERAEVYVVPGCINAVYTKPSPRSNSWFPAGACFSTDALYTYLAHVV